MQRKRVMQRKHENLGLTSLDISSVNITHRVYCSVVFERPNISIECNRAGFLKFDFSLLYIEHLKYIYIHIYNFGYFHPLFWEPISSDLMEKFEIWLC